eukprot:5961519-Amphidinium_carterae.4
MSCEPPRRNGGQDARESRDGPSHPGEPDQPHSPKRSDRGNRKKKEKMGKKKKRSPTPSSSDSDDSSSSSFDDDSSSSSRKKEKGKKKKKEKVKEFEEIRLDNTPHMGEFDDWVFAQRQRMISACKAHQDQSLQLLVSVEKAAREGKLCPEVPKKFPVDKITKKSELGVTIAVLRKEQQEKGKNLSGLLMYHMLLEQYKLSANSSSYFDVKRIQSLRCNGDKDLQRYLADWDTTRMRMKEQPSEYMLTRLFWEQVRNCRDYSFIFEQFENSDEDSYKSPIHG